MALQITKESKFGIEATYWKIERSLEDWSPQGHFTITLYGWTDHNARVAYPQNPIIIKDIEIGGNIFQIDPTRQDVYDQIKLLPDWGTAIDC